MQHLEEARALWKSFVPPRGQAATVQGELLRAAEKLRDQAQRNGNQGWDGNHERLLDFLRRHLGDSGTLTPEQSGEAAALVSRLRDHEDPQTGDEVYDRLGELVVLWARAHPEPVAHARDPDLTI